MTSETPRLISRSCTSGWFDWVWGDLWLTEDALFRVSRGMAETQRAAGKRRGGSTVTDADGTHAMTTEELIERLGGDRRNRHALLGEIQTAKLRRGLLTSRLSLVLRDGTRFKLLWLKADPAFAVLEAVLEDPLGARLKVG
jgi:hypothetical protein